MRQAITTAYHGPTNTNGARVSAKAEAGRIVAHWDHALSDNQNHCEAARRFAEKLGWSGLWIGGAPAKFSGYCFVWAGDTRPDLDQAKASIGTEGRDWFFQPCQRQAGA